jgi:hypothetical protein
MTSWSLSYRTRPRSMGRTVIPVTKMICQLGMFSWLSLILSGCGCNQATSDRQTVLPIDVGPGTLTVDVLESGRPEHYWQYEIRPSEGTVIATREKRFADPDHEDMPTAFQEPAGAVQNCRTKPAAISPDNQAVARCDISMPAENRDKLLIIDAKTERQIYEWAPEEWRGIRGFAWAPNSGSLAILNDSSYYGKNPIELLSALSGHPVPHDTIFLDVVGIKTGKLTEYRVRENVISSFCRILKWTN